MKEKITIFFLLLTLCIERVSAQSTDFDNYYANAIEDYLDKNYESALYYFGQALRIRPRHADANYYAGICYLELTLNKESLESLEKVEATQLSDDTEYNYWMAKSNSLNEKFDKAKEYIEKYLEQGKVANKQAAEALLKELDRAKEVYLKQGDYTVELLDTTFNTPGHEFAFSLDPSGRNFVFSRAHQSYGNPLKDTYQPKSVEVYGGFISPDGQLQHTYRFDDILFADNSTFVLAIIEEKSLAKEKKLFINQNKKLFVADYKKNEWMLYPVQLDKAGISEEAIHATLSANRQSVIFSSNAKGGNFDLYQAHYTPGSGWGKALPLRTLNSDGDEITPFWDEERQRLYFSSTGHRGRSQRFDVFMSDFDSTTGNWSDPKPLPSPINTIYDEAYYIIHNNIAYFSSNRNGGIGGADIYRSYDFSKLFLRGTVTDRHLEKALPNCEIRAVKAGTALATDTVLTNENGYYEGLTLPVNEPMELLLIRDGALLYVEEFQSTGMLILGKEDRNLVHNFHVYSTKEGIPMTMPAAYNPFPGRKPGTRFILKAVKFRSGTSELLPDATKELDRFANFLKENTDMPVIEIGGHTDNVGDPDNNLALSQRRAEAVVRYLTEKHRLPKTQFRSKGYGETQPIASNDDEKEGRQLNRRIEAKLLIPDSPEE
ncbi:MAG: OmpA family protein [Bernardetiaceae bacterium]